MVLRRRRRTQSGQSTIEFALTLTFLMAFVLFFIQLCLVFGFGNYVHYATFMAARAYLAAGDTLASQDERARRVIVQTLKRSEGMADSDRIPFIAKGIDGNTLKGLDLISAGPDERSSWMVGVRYKFRSRIFLLPLAWRGKVNAPEGGRVTLISESWLGREVSYDTCAQRMQEKGWLFDNGC